jgi:hypothetical protein
MIYVVVFADFRRVLNIIFSIHDISFNEMFRRYLCLLNQSLGFCAGYTVEYYSADLQTGWVVAAYRVRTEAFTVDNLRNGDLFTCVNCSLFYCAIIGRFTSAFLASAKSFMQGFVLGAKFTHVYIITAGTYF